MFEYFVKLNKTRFDDKLQYENSTDIIVHSLIKSIKILA